MDKHKHIRIDDFKFLDIKMESDLFQEQIVKAIQLSQIYDPLLITKKLVQLEDQICQQMLLYKSKSETKVASEEYVSLEEEIIDCIVNQQSLYSKARSVNVDDLLACLIYVLIKARQQDTNFMGSLIENFTLKIRFDQAAICLCNFEVAMTFIQSLD